MCKIVIVFCLSLLFGCRSSHSDKPYREALQNARKAYDEKNYTLAIQVLVPYMDFDDAEMLKILAFSHEAMGHTLKAAFLFEQLVHAVDFGEYCEAGLYGAQLYEKLNYVQSAARCYRIYIEQMPKDYEAWLALSNLEYQQGLLPNALSACLNSILGFTTIPTDLVKHLAQLCLLCDILDGAKFWALKAYERDPKDIEVLKLLLLLADRHNNGDKAAAYIMEIEAKDPSFFDQNPELKAKYHPQFLAIQPHPDTITDARCSTTQEIKQTIAIFHPGLIKSVKQSISKCSYLCPQFTY